MKNINNKRNSQVKSYSEKFDALMSDREELIAKIKGEHSNILKLNAWFEKETKMLCKQGEKDAATFLALAAACQDAQENFASVISATNLPDKPFDSVVVTEKFKSPLPPPTRSKQRVLKTVAADSGVSKKKNTFAYGEGAAGLAVGALFVLGLI
ncbi:hypothetical protein BDR26DRAFT_913984 [Obelidium mucronatum]|nr:hypothetical protein BDR26DRAFT_913984 [Obelidium mucronatum]